MKSWDCPRIDMSRSLQRYLGLGLLSQSMSMKCRCTFARAAKLKAWRPVFLMNLRGLAGSAQSSCNKYSFIRCNFNRHSLFNDHVYYLERVSCFMKS